LDDAINISLSGEEVPAVTSTVTGTIMIQQFSDSSVEFSANLMNPDGVALLGAMEPTFCGATRPVMWFLAQPVDGGRMETEVAFSGFSTRPVFWMMHVVLPSSFFTRALWRVALMSTSTVRRILLVRFVDRLSFLTR
jgi:hypothetical protein